MRRVPALLFSTILLAACSSGGTTGTGGQGGTGTTTGTGGHGGDAMQGATAAFDLTADLSSQDHFYDFPYPSDLRLTDKGTPDLTGLPFPNFLKTIAPLQATAMEHPGFPVVPVSYFRFSAPVPTLDASKVIAADKTSPILLVDVDPASQERGTLTPVVATTPPVDGWISENTIAAAPRPGFVLHPKRKYAFVVMKSLGDADGKPLASPAALDQLKAGTAPEGAKGAAAVTLYQPLWDTLKTIGVEAAGVAAATVFTTGDVVQDLSDLSQTLAKKYTISIQGLKVDPDDGATHDRYCELVGKVTYPQFQKGTPPFNTEGSFDFSDGGLPAKQRDEDAPITITIPKGEMPAAGFPLVMYFHGSGGISSAVVDRGTWAPQPDATQCPGGTQDEWDGVLGCNKKGEGPAHVLAPFGFAMAGSALPVNPERLPGAGETAYLNLNNLSAMRDTFRQGVIEQHLFLDALTQLEIDPQTIAACSGISLPAGATKYKLDVKNVFAQGQSMGGMYTNLISAVEPRIRAALPTGAGGYWSHFILITPLIPDIAGKVGTVLLGTSAKLTFLHPGLSLFETAAEAVDPMVSMPRLARRPLPDHPVRPIYEPVGKGDSYFPMETYDAMALAYGHKEAGDIVWATMQEALKLSGHDGILPYPVSQDLTSETGTKYTGVVVQYEGDGVYDPHAIYSQLDAVKYQYGCFFSTFLKTGTATVPAPAPLGTPCP
ncbi:hypothetical protein A7982_12754 [Minicystis rosea]|nr:hypothetical protein A7982_12754 [Minicystis rosea]